MTGLYFFLGAIGVMVLLGLISSRLEAKRRETLRGIAAQLGLQFADTDETGLRSGFSGFNLFSHGRNQMIRNIAYGRLEDVEVMVFEYSYVTGSGKNRQTHHQTVGFFQSDGLSLPEFVARPENLFHKIGQVFGYQDIDLPLHPEFSSRYILRGVNEGAIRDFFTSGVARFFEANPGLSVEAKFDRFILYRPGKRLKPEMWHGWLNTGLQACKTLRGLRGG
jgi:hypothetical protein